MNIAKITKMIDPGYSDFLESNPELFYCIHEASVMLNNLADSGFFNNGINSEIGALEAHIIEELGKIFKKSDLDREIRNYKSHRLIYSIIKSLEQSGLISINKPQQSRNFRKEAQDIYNNYKKRINE